MIDDYWIKIGFTACSPVMQLRLGAARHIQALIFYSQTQARRIQALLSKCLSKFVPYLKFKLHRLFWRQRFSYRFQYQPTNPLQTLHFPLSLGNFHSGPYHQCNASSKKKPKHCLIYHYFAVVITMNYIKSLLDYHKVYRGQRLGKPIGLTL